MRFLVIFLHKLLLKLPPEVAHSCVLRLLGVYQTLFVRRKTFTKGRVLILHAAPKLVLRNRVGLAAGFDKNAEVFKGLLGLGFGFVEVGTVTPLPQPGNPKPRIFRQSALGANGLVNHLGFNSKGLDIFIENLLKMKKQIPVGTLLANIGKNKITPEEEAIEDYKECFERLKDKVDGFVVNLSSPNTPGLRDLQSQKFLESLSEIAPKGVPVLVTFPDLENQAIQNLASWISQSDFSGIVLTNTSRAIAERQCGFKTGGYSGPLLFSRSLECVSLARQAMGKDKLLIGVGGIDSLASAQKMREAGADLVEIYTSFIYQGAKILRELEVLR